MSSTGVCGDFYPAVLSALCIMQTWPAPDAAGSLPVYQRNDDAFEKGDAAELAVNSESASVLVQTF